MQRLRTLGMIAETLDVENVVFGEMLPGAADDAGSGSTTTPGSSGELPRIRLAVFDRLSESNTFEAGRISDRWIRSSPGGSELQRRRIAPPGWRHTGRLAPAGPGHDGSPA